MRKTKWKKIRKENGDEKYKEREWQRKIRNVNGGKQFFRDDREEKEKMRGKKKRKRHEERNYKRDRKRGLFEIKLKN